MGVFGKAWHDVERDHIASEVVDELHSEVDAYGAPVAAHAILTVDRGQDLAYGLKNLVGMQVEVSRVLKDDHDVDVRQRLGLGVAPVGTGEEGVFDIESGLKFPADALLSVAGLLGLRLGDLQIPAELLEGYGDAHHDAVRV